MKKNKTIVSIAFFLICTVICLGQNPIIPGYFADPSIRYIDGLYYISATTDGYEGRSGEPLIWISEDLVNWEVKPMNINSRFFWAPSMVKGKNGKFYMVHQHGIDYNAYISEGESPLGPWVEIAQIGDFDVELSNDPISNEIYGIGSWRNLMIFDNDMNSPDYMKKVIDRRPLQGEMTDFTEAPYIFYKDKKYYLMWAGGKCWLETYNVRYAIADNLIGSYYEPNRNPILETNSEKEIYGPGHTSMIEVNGHWIMFYHKQDKWKFPTCNYRFSCAAEITFGGEGCIEKVEPVDNLDFLKLAKNIKKDLALGKKVTANSFEKDFPASSITDGRNDTRWRAENGEDKSITVDLGKEENISKIQVDFEYFDKFYLFKIEYSDDNNNWLTYADYSTRAEKAYQTRTSEKSIKARYIRVSVTRAEGGYASIWNVKIF